MSEYADIEWSKKLAGLFPDAVYWWWLDDFSTRKIETHRIPEDFAFPTWKDYPAITIQSCLDKLNKRQQKMAFNKYMRTGRPFVDMLCEQLLVEQDEWVEIDGFNGFKGVI